MAASCENPVKLSIVATLYQSAPYLAEFHRRCSESARQLAGDSYELILVNDGSPDRSYEIAAELVRQDQHVVLVDLSRNFGHHKAMLTGLREARGDLVFLIDSDLEEEPEWLLAFGDQLTRVRCDMVFGVQETRKGGLFERWSGAWFWRFFNAVTGLEITENMVTARLMTRRFVDALLLHKEREVFFHGLAYATGFRQIAYTVKKHGTSESTYTLKRKLSLLVNSVTAFSNAPLVGIFYTGMVISLLAFAYIVYLVSKWIFVGTPVTGWTSTIASIWILGGMIISFIGVVGIYLSKIFLETKQRPFTIVREVIRQGGSHD
jgi:putative glycosyltransferase